jgi:hypothetical protein
VGSNCKMLRQREGTGIRKREYYVGLCGELSFEIAVGRSKYLLCTSAESYEILQRSRGETRTPAVYKNGCDIL